MIKWRKITCLNCYHSNYSMDRDPQLLCLVPGKPHLAQEADKVCDEFQYYLRWQYASKPHWMDWK